MVSLKDGFTVGRQSQKEDFLPKMFGSALCLMIAQIHFSLIDKDWMSRKLTNAPTRATTSDNISIFSYLLPPATPKVDDICVSPHIWLWGTSWLWEDKNTGISWARVIE